MDKEELKALFKESNIVVSPSTCGKDYISFTLNDEIIDTTHYTKETALFNAVIEKFNIKPFEYVSGDVYVKKTDIADMRRGIGVAKRYFDKTEVYELAIRIFTYHEHNVNETIVEKIKLDPVLYADEKFEDEEYSEDFINLVNSFAKKLIT